MAAQSSNQVSVHVKTLAGELIPITFDRSKGKQDALRALHEVAPDEFPRGRTRLVPPERPEGTNNRNTSATLKSGNLKEVTNGETLWAVVTESLVSLHKVDGPLEEYDGSIFYVFHAPRKDEKVMEVTGIWSMSDEHYFSEEEIQEYIQIEPVQPILIRYDPQTRQHVFFSEEYDVKDEQIRDTIRNVHIRGSVRNTPTPILPDELERPLFFMETDSDDWLRIDYELTPLAISDILEQIMNHPLTPADAKVFQWENAESDSSNDEQNGGGRRRRTHRRGKKFRKTRSKATQQRKMKTRSKAKARPARHSESNHGSRMR